MILNRIVSPIYRVVLTKIFTEEDVEEIHGQITPYEDEPTLAHSEAAAGTEENEETDLDGVTPAMLEARYEWEIAVSSCFL